MTIIEILMWVSIFTGGTLILLLVLSLMGAGDFEVDTETDSGGLGWLKGGLTFLSVSAWILRLSMISGLSPIMGGLIAIVSGIIIVYLLSYLLRILLKNQHKVNWEGDMAIGKTGKVYLKIPKNGDGIIHVSINGVNREMKARSTDKKTIPTGEEIMVLDHDGKYAIVSKA